MSIWINDEELAAMEGLRDVLIRLYLFGIRKYMDGQTCITGIKRGISYQSLSEQLYEEPIAGFKTRQGFSIQQTRRAVKALENTGLIKIQSEGKKLILKCLLASQGKSVQNKADTRPTGQADREADISGEQENPVNTGFPPASNKNGDTQADIPQTPQADTPLLSISTTLLYTAKKSDFDPNYLPKGAEEWETFLSSFGKFQFHLIKKESVIQMCILWCKKNVTYGDAIVGIEYANAKHHSIHGTKPNSPAYYKNFVLEALEARKQSKEQNNHARTPTNFKTGANGISQRSDYRPSAAQRNQEFADHFVTRLREDKSNSESLD